MSSRIVIKSDLPNKLYWKEVWGAKELLYTLSWRDLKVRYKQTYIGAAWSVIRPLLTTIIFTLIFTQVAKLDNPSSTPYALMVFTGMTAWQFFASSLSEASNSLSGNANLITKIYFPRVVVPLSALLTSLVDFGISLVLIAAMMLFFHFTPGYQVFFLPFFVVLLILFSCGISLLLTGLNVRYRDLRFIIPFIVQFGLYVTPIAFSSKSIPAQWRSWYAFNPMVGIIDGFRWCLLKESFNTYELIVSLVMVPVLLFTGIAVFRKSEKTFADDI